MKFRMHYILIFFFTLNPTEQRLGRYKFTMMYHTNEIYIMIHAHKLRTRSEMGARKSPQPV